MHSEYTVKTRSTGQQAGLFYNLDSPLTRSLPLKRLMSLYDRVPRVFLLKNKKTRADEEVGPLAFVIDVRGVFVNCQN